MLTEDIQMNEQRLFGLLGDFIVDVQDDQLLILSCPSLPCQRLRLDMRVIGLLNGQQLVVDQVEPPLAVGMAEVHCLSMQSLS